MSEQKQKIVQQIIDERTPRERFLHDLILRMQELDMASGMHSTSEERRRERINAAVKAYDDNSLKVTGS